MRGSSGPHGFVNEWVTKPAVSRERKSSQRGAVLGRGSTLPQVPVRATKEGAPPRARGSIPGNGCPSDPLKDAPEPDTHRYFVETVCDRSRWKSETVDPWLMHTGFGID